MLCPNCGWDNPAESNTCMHCGAPLSPETPQTPSTVSRASRTGTPRANATAAFRLDV